MLDGDVLAAAGPLAHASHIPQVAAVRDEEAVGSTASPTLFEQLNEASPVLCTPRYV